MYRWDLTTFVAWYDLKRGWTDTPAYIYVLGIDLKGTTASRVITIATFGSGQSRHSKGAHRWPRANLRGCLTRVRVGKAVKNSTWNHQDSDWNAEKLDDRINSLCADGDFVRVFDGMTLVGRRRLWGQYFSVNNWKKSKREGNASYYWWRIVEDELTCLAIAR